MLNLIELLSVKFPQLNALSSKLIESNPSASLLLAQRNAGLGVMANINFGLLADVIDVDSFGVTLAETDSVLIDIDSINFGDVRFYIDTHDISNDIMSVYTMDKTIAEYEDVKDLLVDEPVIGFILDGVTRRVKFYKYYYNTVDGQQEYNFRFDDEFNFVDLKVYNPLPEVPTEEQLIDFGIDGIDLSDYNLMHFYRESDLQSYMRIVSKPFVKPIGIALPPL